MDAETRAVWRTVELEAKAAAKTCPELKSDRQSPPTRLLLHYWKTRRQAANADGVDRERERVAEELARLCAGSSATN
jgi:hypothetical protein